MQNTRGREEHPAAMWATLSRLAKVAATNSFAFSAHPVAAPISITLSAICRRDFGVNHRICGRLGSRFSAWVTSFPEGAQTWHKSWVRIRSAERRVEKSVRMRAEEGREDRE